MIKAWWTVFLTCGAIAGMLALGPVALSLVLLFTTFVVAPACVILAACNLRD